ncbi:hypothetical protein [Tenacibaculum finnmarkense]|uniref:hypothetical protein n=1 Tax=Tenacibaculum finnmarkense TaxID=2781243 RepID=UPI00187B5B26|nr:hypothetical protein [Tenacibaculum finnmarkense]MCD8405806.1 hypothetical protein [Tenacibaculum dicentrarchi]MBE7660710.1 hypothetical protein [Tenacibaculum finnmarkense genomovar finnmarkense]MCG8252977.1 hypothetical protein [Tenacibaculum finnmarkense genomovar finnmarkense]MCG8816540.1 hypothetical protein [Tenacibaculum finnmarkense]MCG8821586.1 hypothetical protein [Tenacibaculum finnmarkense]
MNSNINTNINTNKALKQAVLGKLSNSSILVKISADTGVNYNTLKRQVSVNHEYLTLYKVLLSISNHLDIPVNELVEKSSL